MLDPPLKAIKRIEENAKLPPTSFMDKKLKDQNCKKGKTENANTYLYTYGIAEGKWFDVMQALYSANQTYAEPVEQAIEKVNAVIAKCGGSASLERE